MLNNAHKHPFNGPLSGTTRVSRYQKGKTNLDFTEDSEWQWHQLGHMQVCTSLHTDNHTSTPPLSFLQAGCPSWHPTNSVKALKAITHAQKTCIFLCSLLLISKYLIYSHSPYTMIFQMAIYQKANFVGHVIIPRAHS